MNFMYVMLVKVQISEWWGDRLRDPPPKKELPSSSSKPLRVGSLFHSPTLAKASLPNKTVLFKKDQKTKLVICPEATGLKICLPSGS